MQSCAILLATSFQDMVVRTSKRRVRLELWKMLWLMRLGQILARFRHPSRLIQHLFLLYVLAIVHSLHFFYWAFQFWCWYCLRSRFRAQQWSVVLMSVELSLRLVTSWSMEHLSYIITYYMHMTDTTHTNHSRIVAGVWAFGLLLQIWIPQRVRLELPSSTLYNPLKC